MWQPVYDKYKLFFDCAEKLAPIVSEMIQTPIQGPLLQMVGQMTAAAANTHGALLTLVLNGYGHDAMKLARSLFEIELNILRLKAHPDEISDYVDYNIIQQKQLYDMLDIDQKKQVPQERYDEMMNEYNAALPRFIKDRKKQIPRSEWCRESLYARAKEAGPTHLDLYRTFYQHASSMYHMDIGGIAAHVDAQMYAHMAPSWEHLDDALVATGSFLRCVGYLDEMAQLGFKDRLEKGPNEDYADALKAL